MILSNLLKIGNCMNAGSNKGQADGFEITALRDQAFTLKDVNRKSIMATIVHKIMAEDSSFVCMKHEFYPGKDNSFDIQQTQRCPTSQIESDVSKMQSECQKLQVMLSKIKREDPLTETTEFGRQITLFFDKATEII